MKKNYVLTDKQKSMVEKYYYLAKKVVNNFHHVSQDHITNKYLREDAIQDALYALCVAACTYSDTHETQNSFESFAQTIMRNHITNIIKHHGYIEQEVSYDEFDYDCVPADYNIEDETCKNILRSKVVCALPERRKNVDSKLQLAYDILVQHYFHGMVMTSVAKTYNISRKTAYEKLNSALCDLRKCVNVSV